MCLIMHHLVLIYALFWTGGRCDVIHDDSVNSRCTEPALVCSELAQLGTHIQQLREELVITKLHSQTETANKPFATRKFRDSFTSTEFHDVMSRADDGGPLEAMVIQMGQQLTAMSADIQALKNTVQILQNANQQQDQNIQDARTSTFVHWGRSQCPSDAQLVYSGAVGGSHYTQSGGGTNYLCLTMSPVFGTHALSGYSAYLYGSEYQTYNDANHDMDALCSVCRASHATTIMIPGTNVCTQGWTKQYDGYLMAERDVHNAAQFICVDSAMESRPGSNADLDGRLLYFTITRCGSLPCGPYENNKIVTCVVCSK